jgi:NADH dehydrogenase (ubiquinone) flavoprotein 2
MIITYNLLIKEDLTPEAAVKIIKSIRAGTIPPPGPVSGRKTCEPINGLTSLKEEPTGPGYGMTW